MNNEAKQKAFIRGYTFQKEAMWGEVANLAIGLGGGKLASMVASKLPWVASRLAAGKFGGKAIPGVANIAGMFAAPAAVGAVAPKLMGGATATEVKPEVKPAVDYKANAAEELARTEQEMLNSAKQRVQPASPQVVDNLQHSNGMTYEDYLNNKKGARGYINKEYFNFSEADRAKVNRWREAVGVETGRGISAKPISYWERFSKAKVPQVRV